MLSMGTKSETPIPTSASSSPPWTEQMIQTNPTAVSSSSAQPPPLPSPPWTELPDDLTANILQRLNTREILGSAQKVCTTWWTICKNPAMWRIIDLDCDRCPTACDFRNNCCCAAHKHVECRKRALNKFTNIFHCAVDRSQGQLVKLRLACYEVDGLLNYIVERSSQLRRLELEEYDCERTIDLFPALKKLPQLEELHIKTLPYNRVDFKTIGISCPILKSFTYDSWVFYFNEFVNYAVAIGKNMPNLRHLRLCRTNMGNKALEAILDGCPHLESLELWKCFGLELEGSLGKRCSHQIKNLKIDLVDLNLDDDSDSG